MNAVLSLTAMVSSVFQSLFQQIGPAYDPLFYDVMVYIFGTMLFAVFLLSVIAFWLRRKGLGGGSAKEKWTQELERYFEHEQIGLIPDEKHHW
jgi:hypothetical protein